MSLGAIDIRTLAVKHPIQCTSVCNLFLLEATVGRQRYIVGQPRILKPLTVQVLNNVVLGVVENQLRKV